MRLSKEGRVQIKKRGPKTGSGQVGKEPAEMTKD